MEMKLNTHRIKALRLTQSWSQEKLAEKAGLNPRTIQRVESDGSASLHTRLCLARAFGVEPQELDLIESVAMSSREDVVQQRKHASLLGSVYHLPLLLLISLVYVAWTPVYFSLSRNNFHADYSWPLTWWAAATFAFWVPLALLWISIAYYRHRSQFRLHLACVAAFLGASFLQEMQVELTTAFLTLALYLSGLALLSTFYRDSRYQTLVRRAFFISLATYVFIWVIEERLYGFLIGNYQRWERGLGVALPWVSFPTYLMRMLGELSQLFPLVLVLLFDLGRFNYLKPSSVRATSNTAAHPAG